MLILALIGVSGITSFAATFALIRLAPAWGLLDHPSPDRKHHQAPTPVVGGLGFALGVIAFLALSGAILTPTFFWLVAAILVLAFVGVADDRFDLKWYWRISAQVFAALLIALPGRMTIDSLGISGMVDLHLGDWAVPFTIFAVVGVVNAINMIDGMDGLAGTLAVISLLAMALLASDPITRMFLWAVIAALIGFLAFNLRRPGMPRAACFLGNSGSAVLGLLLAWSAIAVTHNAAPGPSVAPWLVALPIMDCLIQIARRLLDRRSPFSADRGHLHHLLMSKQWSVGAILCLASGIQVAMIAIGVALYAVDLDPVFLMLIFVAILPLLGLAYWLLNRNQPLTEEALKLKPEQAW